MTTPGENWVTVDTRELQPGALAEKVFGPARVADTVARVAGMLVGWGYLNAQTGRPFPGSSAMCSC